MTSKPTSVGGARGAPHTKGASLAKGASHTKGTALTKEATPARAIALDLLDATMTRGIPLQEAIEANPGYARLDGRGRRFCRRLITQTLRHHGEACAALTRHVKTMPKGRQRMAGLILMMGAAELMFGDAKPHAVVDQSVRLARAHQCGHIGGLINAVLRKIKPAEANPMLNIPDWLRQAMAADWGEAAEPLAAMLMMPPPLDLTPKSASHTQTLAEALGGCITPHGSVRLNDGGVITALPGYDDGTWWVQDAAASLPALLLNAQPDEVVVDLCAAPGGKTAQICTTGARVIAVDKAPATSPRMARLHANMKRLGFAPQVIVADGTAWLPDEVVDRVLVDAPCSATGTIRRRPDILCHPNPPDLTRLNKLQRGLLEQAAKMLKPGGVLVYATCSLLKAEGEMITANPPANLAPMPITDAEIKGFKRHIGTASHEVRLMPDALELGGDFIQGNDGFFITRFRRDGEA